MTWNRDTNCWGGKAVNGEVLLHVRLGGEIETMIWNRDKNSWEGKAVNGEMLLHGRLWES